MFRAGFSGGLHPTHMNLFLSFQFNRQWVDRRQIPVGVPDKSEIHSSPCMSFVSLKSDPPNNRRIRKSKVLSIVCKEAFLHFTSSLNFVMRVINIQ